MIGGEALIDMRRKSRILFQNLEKRITQIPRSFTSIMSFEEVLIVVLSIQKKKILPFGIAHAQKMSQNPS